MVAAESPSLIYFVWQNIKAYEDTPYKKRFVLWILYCTVWLLPTMVTAESPSFIYFVCLLDSILHCMVATYYSCGRVSFAYLFCLAEYQSLRGCALQKAFRPLDSVLHCMLTTHCGCGRVSFAYLFCLSFGYCVALHGCYPLWLRLSLLRLSILFGRISKLARMRLAKSVSSLEMTSPRLYTAVS